MMRMDELKRGFWGYKKDSVYHYIVSLEEKASERMAEKESKLEQLEAEMERQLAGLEQKHKIEVAGLEAEMAALRKENESLRKDQSTVFSTMLEAQKYADQLKADSMRQSQQAQERLSAAIEQKARQLDSYQEQLERLREMIRELLEDFDGKLEETKKTMALLPAQAPSSELDGGKTPGTGVISSFVIKPDTAASAAPDGMPAASGQETFQAKPNRGKGEAWKKISFT